jgi:hypothetical protein
MGRKRKGAREEGKEVEEGRGKGRSKREDSGGEKGSRYLGRAPGRE